MHCEKEEKKPNKKINVNANPSTAHNRAQIPQENAEKEFKFKPKTGGPDTNEGGNLLSNTGTSRSVLQ
jgi:hypothetical protein